jgi:hypothetical protein
MGKRFGLYEWITVAIAVAIMGFAIGQAIVEQRWGPVWTAAVIPAALVASLGSRRTKYCWPGSRQRPDA